MSIVAQNNQPNSNKLLDSALFYAKIGWLVLPLHSINEKGVCNCSKGINCENPGKHPRWHHIYIPDGLKSATDDMDTIRKWWELWPDSNIGIATGPESGIVVLDIDVKNDGYESMKELIGEHGQLPPTVEAITGSGGRHILFKHPGWFVRNSVGKIAPGIDVRGDGGYIVAAPSVHKSGNAYVWEHSPKDTELAEIPSWLADRLHEKVDKVATKARAEYQGKVWEEYLTGRPIQEGERNNTLFKIGCSLRAKGASYEDIEATLQAVNETRCRDNPLSPNEVLKIAQSAAKYPEGRPGEEQEKKTYALTDYGNAERLVDRHGLDLRYCEKLGGWYVWDGSRWMLDETGEIIRRAKETVRRIRKEALSIQAITEEQEKLKEALIKHAKTSESRNRINNMIDLAKSEPGIPAFHSQFDASPWLLTVKNGTINLKTGQLQPHRREDLITKMAPVEYDPRAACPRWMAFLDEIMAGDKELIEFLQKAVGYSLTGSTSEQVMFFLYGGGANGKSTFLNIIQDMMGDYSQQAPASLLMAKANDGVPNDIARLKGARFVATIETEDGKRMAEALVKQVTGGDTITARFLRQEFFEFKPECKVFLCSNHKPIINGTDYAIWRRIHLIPFEVQIPPEKRDKQLPEKLREELPGILRWAVEGCLKWQQEGLKPPAKVVAATEEYKEEMDSLGAFIVDCCVKHWSAKVSPTSLYNSYREWCEENGERAMNQRMFNKRLKERGFNQARTGQGRYWSGIGLIDNYPNLVSDTSDRSDNEKGINKKMNNTFYSYTENNVTNVTSVTHGFDEVAATSDGQEWGKGEPRGRTYHEMMMRGEI